MPAKKKKKVDRAALNSRFMRIPRMDVGTARTLLDLGFNDIDELRGRCPEALFESAKAQRADLPPERICSLRMAVYFAEAESPEPSKLHPAAWL